MAGHKSLPGLGMPWSHVKTSPEYIQMYSSSTNTHTHTHIHTQSHSFIRTKTCTHPCVCATKTQAQTHSRACEGVQTRTRALTRTRAYARKHTHTSLNLMLSRSTVRSSNHFSVPLRVLCHAPRDLNSTEPLFKCLPFSLLPSSITPFHPGVCVIF